MLLCCIQKPVFVIGVITFVQSFYLLPWNWCISTKNFLDVWSNCVRNMVCPQYVHTYSYRAGKIVILEKFAFAIKIVHYYKQYLAMSPSIEFAILGSFEIFCNLLSNDDDESFLWNHLLLLTLFPFAMKMV